MREGGRGGSGLEVCVREGVKGEGEGRWRWRGRCVRERGVGRYV